MKNDGRGLVLGASLLINLFVGAIYIWSVFAAPLEQQLNCSAAVVALTFTIANGISPITMVTGGKLLDKYGPKWVVFAGGVLFGGGMIASGYTHSAGELYLTYGLMVGFGMGLVYSCTIANTVKFFPDKKGLVSGLSTGAYGLSSVILAPAAQNLIDLTNVMDTFKIIGTAALITICGSALLLRKAPRQEEYLNEDFGNEKDWKEMLRAGDFYLLLVMLTIGASAGLMIISQASSMTQELVQATAGQAALAVSIISLSNAGGRVLWGIAADRIGNYRILPVLFFLLAISMLNLFLAGGKEPIVFFSAVILIGFCFGGFMAVFPSLTAEKFGLRNNGTNYGIVFCGFAIGGFLGPRLAAVFQVTEMGLYTGAFLTAGILCLSGLILAIMMKKRHL